MHELLLSGIYYQTLHHPFGFGTIMLYHARRCAHFIAAISTRSLAVIVQIQTQIQTVIESFMYNKLALNRAMFYSVHVSGACFFSVCRPYNDAHSKLKTTLLHLFIVLLCG